MHVLDWLQVETLEALDSAIADVLTLRHGIIVMPSEDPVSVYSLYVKDLETLRVALDLALRTVTAHTADARRAYRLATSAVTQ